MNDGPLRFGGALASLWLLQMAKNAWGVAHSTRDMASTTVAVTLLALFLVIAFESFLARLPRRYTLHVLVAIACGLTVYAAHTLPRTSVTSDEMYFSLAGGQELLAGNNPYGLDLSAKQYAYPAPPHKLNVLFTHTTTGAFERELPYPALSMLFYLPADIFRFNPAWLGFAALIAAIGVLVWFAPPAWRTLAPLAFLVNGAALDTVGGFVEDIPYVLPLMIAAFFWMDAPLVAAGALGLACAVKQLPWLDVPFFLVGIMVAASGSFRQKLKRALIALVVTIVAFMIPNAYFALTKPLAWFHGITEPFRQPYLNDGLGVVAFNLFASANIPRWELMLAGGLALAVLIAIAYRWFPLVRNAVWVAPGIALFFAPRSLEDYFVFLIPVCMASWFGQAPEALRWKKRASVTA